VQKLEKEKAIAEYETLKHQVNPHFLFNSFNTLIQVIDEDKEKAIEYTQMLSDYYRSLLSYASVNLVTLEEEFVLLEKYMYLQKMRFGTSLRLQNDCDASLVNEMEIPPFTLQLLAENAIKHTIISTEKPLTICISISHNRLVVSNNLNEKAQKVAGENIGLQNIRNRFRLFSRQEVEIYKTSLIFEVRLPILKS
jgi:LytS/YehU family sensor histidine kinase